MADGQHSRSILTHCFYLTKSGIQERNERRRIAWKNWHHPQPRSRPIRIGALLWISTVGSKASNPDPAMPGPKTSGSAQPVLTMDRFAFSIHHYLGSSIALETVVWLLLLSCLFSLETQTDIASCIPLPIDLETKNKGYRNDE